MGKSRSELISELNLAVQRQGTLTVLFTHAIAQHIGLSASEFEFCDVLQSQGPTSAGQLAKLCGLSTGGVTGLVDRLEKAGLVRRVADPADRRRVVIEPLDRSDLSATVRKLYEPVAQAFDQLVAGYSDAELAIILGFINSASRMVEDMRAGLSTKRA
ncbi:MAG TPA: MarR family transcriptional regulator [Candidatus Saccharimonadia bacterium]|jgi:DNA-binding MarR family transcriptional regulator|nr:MarR family transcriptional regulator [Candidatus Saccharimonadia bacterium]